MMMYKKGERGHPFLSPLVAWKNGVGRPFIRGVIQGVDMHAPIQEMKEGLNQISLKIHKETHALHNQRNMSYQF